MIDDDKSSPRYVVRYDPGEWCVYNPGGINLLCRVPIRDGNEAVARTEAETIAAALNREPAFAALVAALKGLLHAFLRETSEGDGVHDQDVPTVDAATAALKLAGEP